MDDVRENDQCLFYVAVSIILVTESKEELDSVTETIETIGKRNSVVIDTNYLKQREALNTAVKFSNRLYSYFVQSIVVSCCVYNIISLTFPIYPMKRNRG